MAETFPYYPKEFGLDPATYHNGAVWPWVNFMDCWARIRLGQKDDAIDIIKRVGRADIIVSGDWSANEHIKQPLRVRTSVFIYKVERCLVWYGLLWVGQSRYCSLNILLMRIKTHNAKTGVGKII